ncbi:hypothetical protein GIB67_025534 [Kingdonia uniflora]|uniref:Aminotransferase-like plant mobile domain-containing protein n=1 Tax=Kingdonia uniflora TaxID=39325 RepID=A0A7J7M0C3_9MAGN|nr:hypothetical protein GIB67_025534 [Kingdonia uniflora]
MNDKVPPTASNRRKGELAREGDLVTYKRKRKTIDPTTVVPPNTVESANEGVSEPVPPLKGSQFDTESAQAVLGAQPPLPNVSPDSDVNISIVGGDSKSEGATSNEDVGPSDISLLRSFKFHRARSIALGQEKLPLRVHHHPPTWDLTKEPQAVQDYVKLKGLDRIGAISYNSYNSALISAFAERWQPKTSSFQLKWGEMTPTFDYMEQLVRLRADGDATVIAGSWGFPALVEVFENNLLQGLKAFKALKAGGAGNLLSLKKLRDHYAYKLGKVLNDGTATSAKKKKGLTAKSVARAYMLYVCGSFLFSTKKGTNVNARYLDLFAKDKVAKKWSWGSAVLAHMYYNLGAASRDDGRQVACCTTLLEKWDASITDRYAAPALLMFREALDKYKLEDVVWGPYRNKRDSAHAFKEFTFFNGVLASPDHVQPYYPNRVVRKFNQEQGIPGKRLITEILNLWSAESPRKFNHKYEWVDCFSGQKWKDFVLKKADRGRRVREGPLVCTEGYLEWFASVSWTTICPIVVDLAADDDARVHQ